MSDLTSEQIHEAFEWTMKEVQRRYAAGELDMSGRYYSDEELKKLMEAPSPKDSPEAAA
jgi:hypothetical protein